jgi:molybdopterin synthase sulfur carrier subunit
VKIKIRYFGQFRDFTGKNEEIIDAKDGITVKEIREQIRDRYSKIAAKNEVLVAVNGSFGSLEQVIMETDEVAFFPPVSGG